MDLAREDQAYVLITAARTTLGAFPVELRDLPARACARYRQCRCCRLTISCFAP